MRKLLIPAIFASALVAAVPAVAQDYRGDRSDRSDYRYDRGDNRFDRQIDQLINRIQRAEDRDLISPREEDRLLRQARQLNYVERRYSRNGLSRWEAQDLQRRIQNLRSQFRWERQDGRYSARY